ncbi:MAG: hypothetical protein L0H53_00240 [Candidatus Nitrosocosmicus sp.]|nr:hypothetical protein [Candidatus Nitrosocosmicus sp.]MDN5866362.1 hypothetical protein [Candidatus Nitrosocosmicus sp.]
MTNPVDIYAKDARGLKQSESSTIIPDYNPVVDRLRSPPIVSLGLGVLIVSRLVFVKFNSQG